MSMSKGGQAKRFKIDFYGNLDCSPWLHSDMNDFIGKFDNEAGVYEFNGTYFKYKNGNCRFSGKVIQVL